MAVRQYERRKSKKRERYGTKVNNPAIIHPPEAAAESRRSMMEGRHSIPSDPGAREALTGVAGRAAASCVAPKQLLPNLAAEGRRSSVRRSTAARTTTSEMSKMRGRHVPFRRQALRCVALLLRAEKPSSDWSAGYFWQLAVLTCYAILRPSLADLMHDQTASVLLPRFLLVRYTIRLWIADRIMRT